MPERSRQPGPITALWEWQYQGACLGMDSSIFFHPEGERGSSRRRRDESAKAVCATCPVIINCREHALATHEPYGVWGGLTEEERRAQIARQEQRHRDPPVAGGRCGTASRPRRRRTGTGGRRISPPARPGTRHLATTARTSRAERMRYSSPWYLISVPPYLE